MKPNMHSQLLAFFVIASITVSASAQAANPAPERLHLWAAPPSDVHGPDTDTDPAEPTMDVYLPANPSGAALPAIVVFPGGGYTHLSTAHEGSEIAHMLLSHQIAAFVVRYRHAPRYAYPDPILDGRRAIRLARSLAGKYNVDPHRIGEIGFSAGGHLAATLATQFDSGNPTDSDPIERVSCRPDFAVLLYPVITFTQDKFVHKGSRQALTGGKKELWPLLSAELHVTHQTPPVILFHATTDTVVPPENSVLFYEACLQNKVPAELHIFEIGRHGFGLAATDPALRVWPDLMVTWMSRNHWLNSPTAAN